MDLSDSIDGMMRALDDEIAESRKEPADLIHLSDGTRQAHPTGPHAVYRFSAERTRPLRPGVHGLLTLPDGTDIPASVVNVDRDAVSMAVGRDLGTRVPEAALALRNDQLLQWLRERLRDHSRALRIGSLGHRLVSGEGGASLPHPIALEPRDLQGLNVEQAAALRSALDTDLGWIWGPPGTGKTITAGAIADAWARRGTSVLLTGPTNIAVDRLLLAFLHRHTQRCDLEPGAVIRVGAIEMSPLDREYGPTVSLGAEVVRRAEPLKERLREIGQQLKELRGTNSAAGDANLARRSLLLEDFRRLDAEIEHLPQTVIAEARVIATTAHRAGLGWLRREFDAVVIDEASMLSLAWSYATAISVRHRAVVSGDPHQLGPVVRARSTFARQWLGTSAADVTGPQMSLPAPPCIQLKSQYRMHPEICRVVAQASYEGTLRTPATLVRDPLSANLPGPVLYVDTGHLRGRCLRPPRGGSRMNPRQAIAVARLAAWMAAEAPGCRGAVLTPYRAQRHLIQKEVRRFPEASGRVDVGTIHGYQGDSVAYVIVDVTDGPGLPPSLLLRGTRPTDPGPRLLTVAMSRAEHHLIVVGDLSWLARAVPSDAFLVRFLRLLENSGCEFMLPDVRTHDPWQGNSHRRSRKGDKLKAIEFPSDPPRDQ